MNDKKEYLENKIKKLTDEDDQIVFKKWNEGIISKLILLFPTVIFFLTFLKINNDKTIFDLLFFLCLSTVLITVGLIFNFFLTKK